MSEQPIGGTVEGDEIRILARKTATGDAACALGSDDPRDRWHHPASANAGILAAADHRLDGVVDDWVRHLRRTALEPR